MRDLPPNLRYRVTAGAGSTSKVKFPAKVNGRTPGAEMNKLEAAYMQYLNAIVHTGELEWAIFGSVKLRLADKTWYTPDVMVGNAGCVEFHEVKGFLRDDAAVKFKVAAERFNRFRFKMIFRRKGEWIVARDSWGKSR